MARVLILDDERSIRITLTAFLKGAGHEVVDAETVGQAEIVLAKTMIDVAVVDILIGSDNGLDFARTALERNPNIQIILITGEPEVNSARTAIHLGVFDYLVKPVGKDKIVETVMRAAEKKDHLDKYDQLQAGQEQYRDNLEQEVLKRTQELAASEAKYRSLIENLNDVIYNIDSDGVITYASPVVYDVLGYRPSDVEGMAFEGLIHPDYLSLVRDEFNDAMRGARKPVEFPIKHADGGYLWVRASGQYVGNLEGEVHGVQGVLTDISVQRDSVMALVSSEEKYRTIVDQLSDALFLHDLNGNIEDVNVEAIRRYGYSREELLSLRVADLDAAASERGDAVNIWRSIELGEKSIVQTQHRKKDGATLSVVVSISPVYLEGERHIMALAQEVPSDMAEGAENREASDDDA